MGIRNLGLRKKDIREGPTGVNINFCLVIFCIFFIILLSSCAQVSAQLLKEEIFTNSTHHSATSSM